MKVEKSQSQIFGKKSWFGNIPWKVFKLAKIRHFDNFLKNDSNNFFLFGLKLVVNMTFNLSETYFSEKFAIWRYMTLKSSKNCPNWGFWPFYPLCIISFPWFCKQRKVAMMSSCFLAIQWSSQCILVWFGFALIHSSI